MFKTSQTSSGVALPVWESSGLVPLVAARPGLGNGLTVGDVFGADVERALMLIEKGHARILLAAEEATSVSTSKVAASVVVDDKSEDVAPVVASEALREAGDATAKKGRQAVPRPRS